MMMLASSRPPFGGAPGTHSRLTCTPKAMLLHMTKMVLQPGMGVAGRAALVVQRHCSSRVPAAFGVLASAAKARSGKVTGGIPCATLLRRSLGAGSGIGVCSNPVCVSASGASPVLRPATVLRRSEQTALKVQNVQKTRGDGKRGYGSRGINDFWDPNTMYYIIGANVVVFVLWQNHNLRRFMVEHFALSTAGQVPDLHFDDTWMI